VVINGVDNIWSQQKLWTHLANTCGYVCNAVYIKDFGGEVNSSEQGGGEC
jgi:hypothetical protein